MVVAGQGTRGAAGGRAGRWGPFSDQDKAALLASADVFVAPHRERESFGIVLVEALASGAAVVASDLPAFVDLLPAADGTHRSERSSRSVDHRALARGGDRGAEQAGSEPDRGAAAAEFSSRPQFDWSRVGAAVLSVYQDVLGPQQSPGWPDTRASPNGSRWPTIT